jgi:enoyl-CoA hydratase/carnithine racemase
MRIMSGSTNVHEIAVPSRLAPAGVEAFGEALRAPLGTSLVVLRGEGPDFCDGLDLGAVTRTGADAVSATVHAFARALLTLRRCPWPTLAFVTGSARGGGVGIVAACDFVVAAPWANFALPEGIFGLAPAIVAPFVRERTGDPALRRLALTAASLDAAGALAAGLVDEVTAKERDVVVRRYARVVARTAGVAMALKRDGGPTAHVVEAAAEHTAARLSEPDIASRIRAFVDDGRAPWEARP